MNELNYLVNKFGVDDILVLVENNDGNFTFVYKVRVWVFVACLIGACFLTLAIWRWRQEGVDILVWISILFVMFSGYSVIYSLSQKKHLKIIPKKNVFIFYKKSFFGKVEFELSVKDISTITVVKLLRTTEFGNTKNWVVMLVLNTGQELVLGESIFGFTNVEIARQVASLISLNASIDVVDLTI